MPSSPVALRHLQHASSYSEAAQPSLPSLPVCATAAKSISGYAVFPASLPPTPGLTAGIVFLRSKVCYALPSVVTPCVSLRLPSSAPVGSFHPTRFCPCWAHWGGLSICAPVAYRRSRRVARLVTLSLGVPKIKRARSNPLGVGPRLK